MSIVLNDLLQVHAQGPYETPYVVRFSNVTTLSEPQLCFTFKHPNRGELHLHN